MGTDQCGIEATGISRCYGFEHASFLPLENPQVSTVTGKQVSPGNASTMTFTLQMSNNSDTACHWRVVPQTSSYTDMLML